MSDLIESLRYHAEKAECGDTNVNEDLHDAADLIEQQQARIAELEQREQELTATVERLQNIASDLAKYPDGTVRGNDAREAWFDYERRLKESPNG